MMGKRVLIAIAAGLLLMSASGALADVIVHEEWVTVPEQKRVTGGPEGWTATPPHRVQKGGIAPGDVRPEYITGWGYTPLQISEAYGFSGSGAGQTVAIVVAYGSPSIADDLGEFCSTYSLGSPTLNIYYVGGEPPGYDADWALETSLDVEWVHALAPGATIDLVIAPTNDFSDLFSAVQYAAQTLHAPVVSMSWGGDEFPGEASYDRVLKNTGTVFITASGDSGSGVQYPAASPYVVAAGGTSLYLKPGTGNLLWPEVAWEGSGGGVSLYESTTPSYQTPFGLTGGRCVPDVAFVADPNTGVWVYDSNYDSYSNAWYVVGGTSVAAQSCAAIIALANQLGAAARTPIPPLTDGHSALYTLAGSSAHYNVQGCYRDITAGYNGDFQALVGYDFITGLGSPKAGVLVPALK
jgi:subtilase family serine protease